MTATEVRPVSEPMLPAPGRRRRRIALIIALVVVVGVFATWLIAFSPVFGVKSVQVHGLAKGSALRTTTIEQAARVDYGQPVVRVDTAAITERVEQLPQVASAEVRTSFPGTVIIDVTERTPVGYVMLAGRHMLVDRTGRQFMGVDSAPDLPRLVVPTGADRDSAAAAVATVAAALPRDLRAATRSVQALDPNSITVVLRGRGDADDVLVQWGTAQRSREKAAVVEVLRQRKHSRPAQIDVTDPTHPFTR